MNLLKLLFKPERAAPMLALTFASAVSVALVIARILWSVDLRYAFLVWNLFLAWLPLVFALLACDEHQRPVIRWGRFIGLAGAWLLFFPNAPYIFTDLVHLPSRFYPHFWVDLTVILPCALTGLVLGFLSLYSMQTVVTRRFGRLAGWGFVGVAAGLSSVGVYLGRFLRFNSWDLFLRPVKMYRRLDAWIDGPLVTPTSVGFLVLFATFFFLAYVMLYALTHLSPARAGEADFQSA